MKKTIAALLALTMAVSLSSAALAKESNAAARFRVTTNPYDLYYKYDADEGYLVSALPGEFEPGDTIYLRVYDPDGISAADARKYDVYADWNMGSDLVTGLELSYSKAALLDGTATYHPSIVLDASSPYNGYIDGDYPVTVPVGASETQIRQELETVILGSCNHTAVANSLFASETDLMKDGWIFGDKYYKTTETAALTAAVDAAASSLGLTKEGGRYKKEDGTYYDTVFDIPSVVEVTESAAVYASTVDGEGGVPYLAEANRMDAIDYYTGTVLPPVAAQLAAAAVIGEGDPSFLAPSYGYFAAIHTAPSETAESVDLVGEVGVFKSRSDAKKYAGVKIALTIKNDGESIGSMGAGGDYPVGNKHSVVSFEGQKGEIDLEFGKGNLALFVVDITGQDKLNLAYSTDYDSKFLDMYPDAHIDFLSFPGKPVFDKLGYLYIYAPEDTFLYEVTPYGAKAVKAVYDTDYDAWKVRTRSLTSYAISDSELKLGTPPPEGSKLPGGAEGKYPGAVKPTGSKYPGGAPAEGVGTVLPGTGPMKPNPSTGR